MLWYFCLTMYYGMHSMVLGISPLSAMALFTAGTGVMTFTMYRGHGTMHGIKGQGGCEELLPFQCRCILLQWVATALCLLVYALCHECG